MNTSAARHRVAALWFPDWPVQAARLNAEGLTGPVAIARSFRVVACDGLARAAGVRRGMRIRQAQAVCPELTVVDYQPDRDGAEFAALAASLDEVTSTIEVIRPGLVVADAAAAGRFYGGEDTAVEMMVDAVSRRGVDTAVGVADELATAFIAARHHGVGAVVDPGQSRDFLALLPVSVLSAEVALECPDEVVEQLGKLGIATLGQLAQLPLGQVVTRFGAAGKRCHEIASAAPDRAIAPAVPAADLAVRIALDEPIARVDAAAFTARTLAARLHAQLAAAGLICQRLCVRAEFTDGTVLERLWRTRQALDEAATADRVRWQLDGWLTARRGVRNASATRGPKRAGAGVDNADGAGATFDAGDVEDGAGIIELVLEPVETDIPGMVEEESPPQVISRVQSTLGFDRVLQPHAVGGRGVAERIAFVPYGEQDSAGSDSTEAEHTWPGRILAPLPARLGHPAARVQLVDATSAPVTVTAEALLSAPPVGLQWGRHRHWVTAWAGPWPVDSQWWTGEKDRVARLQVVGEGHAWLLAWAGGQWRVEASYN